MQNAAQAQLWLATAILLTGALDAIVQVSAEPLPSAPHVPTISGIADQTIRENTTTSAIPFTVDDADTGAANLDLSASSSNLDLVPPDTISIGGSGSNRTLTITPLANQSGSAVIRVTVSDGQFRVTRSFFLTVLPYPITTLAGKGSAGSADGTGRNAQFFDPSGIAVDGAGNLYVADTLNHTIRKITSAGVVTTIAGFPGNPGSADGTGGNAQFFDPSGIAVDDAGNLYVADTLNHTIRKITSAGVVTTIAGFPGNSGSADGTGGNAQFFYPSGIAVDGAGNLYVADAGNNTIRQITATGMVTTIAGLPGSPGSADGMGTNARFASPSGIAVDGAGRLYVADTGNNTIRKITAAGVVTIAGSPMSPGSTDGPGSNARFIQPGGIAVDDAGHLYVADTGNNTIRKITAAGMVSTIAGFPGSPGSADGTGSTARFTQPSGIAAEGADNLYVYVADSGNNTIRKAFFTECFPNLPDPVLTFTGTIDDTVNGQELTSYQIPVNNWADFPDALFTATPDLPACPLNKSSSRSLVNIFDEKGNYIDGFCALTKAADLQLISFSIARSQVPPASVYVEIADRRCIQYYRSPVIDLRPVASVARNVDSSITVQWTGAGTLQTAPAVTGPWQDVIEATSPYRLEPTGAALFGRIKR